MLNRKLQDIYKKWPILTMVNPILGGGGGILTSYSWGGGVEIKLPPLY